MKIKLITIYAGPRGTYAAGDVADFPEDEARAMIEGRHADEFAEAPAADETATAIGGKGVMPKKALTPAQENRRAAAAAKRAARVAKAQKAAQA